MIFNLIRKIFNYILMLIILVIPIIANSTDYDGDGINDKAEATHQGDTLYLTLVMSSIKQSLTYIIKPVDICNPPSFGERRKKGEIFIDWSCFGRQAQIITNLYEWSSEQKNWILTKIITGEKSDPIEGIFIPSIDITRVKCCTKLGDDKSNIIEKTKLETHKEINNELEKINILLNKNKIDEAISQIDIYDAIEYSEILNDENLLLLNNLSFYLTRNDNIASGIILDKIVSQYPTRIVAKINLADIYWDLGDSYNQYDKAKYLYKEYKEDMIQKNLKRKIPERVIIRTK